MNLVSAHQLHGKELSYNNLLDLDSALAIVRTLPGAAAVVIKHNNPCGAATAASLAVAMRRALDGDPVSAFGSVIGVNGPLDAATAELLCEPERFIEAIVAPSYEAGGGRDSHDKAKMEGERSADGGGAVEGGASRLAISADRRRNAHPGFR